MRTTIIADTNPTKIFESVFNISFATLGVGSNPGLFLPESTSWNCRAKPGNLRPAHWHKRPTQHDFKRGPPGTYDLRQPGLFGARQTFVLNLATSPHHSARLRWITTFSRKVKTPIQAVSLLAVLFASYATGADRTVAFSFENKSEHRLNWVSLEEAKINPIGGALSPGVFKTAVDQIWRNDVGARVTFIDFETRKPHSISISFAEVNKHLQAGQCRHVIITILDYDKATVLCE